MCVLSAVEQIKDSIPKGPLMTDLKLYLELPDRELAPMPEFPPKPDSMIIVFIKYFDVSLQKMEYVSFACVCVLTSPLPPLRVCRYLGKITVPKLEKVESIHQIITGRLKCAPDTKFDIYEEVKPGMIEFITNLQKTFAQLEIGDGDILVYQKSLSQQEYVDYLLVALSF